MYPKEYINRELTASVIRDKIFCKEIIDHRCENPTKNVVSSLITSEILRVKIVFNIKTMCKLQRYVTRK